MIVVGQGKVHRYGLPKKGFKLFKPFLYELDKLGLATTIKQAKRLVEEKSEVWDSLEHIIETQF